MTPHEKHLWYDFLVLLPVTVRRQKVIGNYIADFYYAKGKLIIELDGLQHGKPAHSEHDRVRTEFLESLGYKVVRYSNYEIDHNFSGVCKDILEQMGLSELTR